MRRTIMILSGLLAISSVVRSQDQVGCAQLLEDAKEAYSAGMVELVPELLGSCLESGLSGERKQEAYILVISAYLFDYLPDEADALMGKFLEDFPDYQAKASDPSEFALLLDSYREEHPVETDPGPEIIEETVKDLEVEEEKKPEITRKQAQPPRRSPGKSQVVGMGFILGTNLSMPQMLEPYSITDPLEASGDFGIATPGFHLGAAFNLPLSSSVDLGIDLLYVRARYNFSASPYRWTNYSLKEGQGRFMLPVSFRFHLSPYSQNSFYLKLGIIPDYLLSASVSATRSFTDDAEGEPDIELDKTDVLDMRSRMNLYLAGGAGMQFPVDNGFIFAELSYQHSLLRCNLPEARYENQDLIWQIYHVDSDFKLHFLNISVGMIFNLNK